MIIFSLHFDDCHCIQNKKDHYNKDDCIYTIEREVITPNTFGENGQTKQKGYENRNDYREHEDSELVNTIIQQPLKDSFKSINLLDNFNSISLESELGLAFEGLEMMFNHILEVRILFLGEHGHKQGSVFSASIQVPKSVLHDL